jgi:hypothetical protein
MRFIWFSGALAGLALVGSPAVHGTPTGAHGTVIRASLESRPSRLDNISDWNSFYNEFRRAVEHRDRRALRSAMDVNFRYTFDRTLGGDPRDEAFEVWDRTGSKLWTNMEHVLMKGSRNDPEVPGLMVSPPAWVEDNRYIGYRAGFMKVGGNWRWIWYVTGDF